MRLAQLGYLNLQRFDDLEIDDVPFFFNLAFRLIEDLDLVAYIVARARGKTAIDLDAAGEALGLIQSGHDETGAGTDAVPFAEAPEQAFVNVGMVRDVARSPYAYDDQSVALLAKYVNFQLNNMLIGAARDAQRADQARIRPEHCLPHIAAWPYPLNRRH